MGKYANLFNYFRQCPQLADLWSIAANEQQGVSVILPQGASPARRYDESVDVDGNYICEIKPYLSLYEDFQINCYKSYDVNDDSQPSLNLNVLTLEDVQAVCDWIEAQDAAKNFPDIGEKVFAIECLPRVPQIRYADANENVMAYYITVRIRYVNKDRGRYFEYDYSDQS